MDRPMAGNCYPPAKRAHPDPDRRFFATFVAMAAFSKSLTPQQALQKLKHYCAYQERCHSEVRDKLFSLGIWKRDQDAIIATLIEENYLNEERFALAYAGGKYRMKQWGRQRIRYELKQKQVSDYSIKKALKQIDEVNMELSTPTKAGLIKPTDQDENEDLLMLVMPLMLNQ